MEKEALFKIRLREVPEEGLSLEMPLPKSWLSAVFKDTAVAAGPRDGAMRLVVHPVGSRQYLVSGSIEADLLATCVSCLTETRFPMRSEIKLLVQNDPGHAPITPSEDGQDLEDSEQVVVTGDVLVLDGALRDTLLLEVPMSPRCRPDCDGWRKLLPQDEKPGMNPRLAALATERGSKEG